VVVRFKIRAGTSRMEYWSDVDRFVFFLVIWNLLILSISWHKGKFPILTALKPHDKLWVSNSYLEGGTYKWNPSLYP
jgi:hypothetical protein